MLSSFKDWLTAITLNDEAEESAKQMHRAEEEQRTKQRLQSNSQPIMEGLTFAELFWSIWKEQDCELPHDNNHCYIFEVLSSRQKYVVRRWKGMDDQIVLHGVRDIRTLKELDPQVIASQHRGWRAVHEFKWNEILDTSDWSDERKKDRRKQKEGREEIEDAISRIMRTITRWNPLEREGIVLCDAAWNRLKIRYLSLEYD